MANKTNIEWTDYSSNPFFVTTRSEGKRGWHCDKPSAGCGHCYSETLNKRFGTGLTYKASNAHLLDFHVNEKELGAILQLNDRLTKKGETANLFPFDMTDVFLDQHSDELLIRTFAVFAACKNITFQILTKRARRMNQYFNRFGTPDNFWLGVSVENQEQANKRVLFLIKTPARVRFISYEPALESVKFKPFFLMCSCDSKPCECRGVTIQQIIIGGESGANARPFDIEWARSVIKECDALGISVFVKQLGAKPYDSSEKWATPGSVIVPVDSEWRFRQLKSKKGSDMLEWPEDLRIREMPEVKNEQK